LYAESVHRREGGFHLTNWVLALAIPAALAALSVNPRTDQPGVQTLILLGMLQLAPLSLGLLRGRFSFLEFVFVSHFVSFTGSRLNMMFNLEKDSLLGADTILASEVLIKCTLLTYCVHLMIRSLLFRRHFKDVEYQPLVLPTSRYIWLLAGLMLLPSALPYLPGGLAIPIFSASVVVFVIVFTSKVDGGDKLVTWARVMLLLNALNHFIVTGFMTLFGQYAVVFFIHSCLKRQVFSMLLLVVMVGALSAIQSVKADYRNYLMGSGGSLVEQFSVLSSLLQAKYSGDTQVNDLDRERDRDLAQGLARAGDSSLETVLSMTPSVVPYWNGETYETIPFMFIPRFLWPEKPSRSFWNKYGHLYGILSDDDNDTSVGVGVLAEAYMNYGYTGLYLFCFLFAFFINLVERLSVYFLGGPTLVSFLVFLIPIMPYSSDLGTMLNSLFLCCFALIAVRIGLVSGATRGDAYGERPA